jgi:hypothetical protein
VQNTNLNQTCGQLLLKQSKNQNIKTTNNEITTTTTMKSSLRVISCEMHYRGNQVLAGVLLFVVCCLFCLFVVFRLLFLDRFVCISFVVCFVVGWFRNFHTFTNEQWYQQKQSISTGATHDKTTNAKNKTNNKNNNKQNRT